MAKEQISQTGLSPQQVAFYDAFGFIVLRQIFSCDEMQLIEHDFETVMLEDRDGEPFKGEERQALCYVIENRVDFSRLMRRISDVAEQLLGAGTVFVGTDANLFVGDTGWHADLGWHYSMLGGRNPAPSMHFYRGLKVAMLLDKVAGDSGCLRVIPTTHIMPNATLDVLAPIIGYAPHNYSADGTIKQFGIPPTEVPCQVIESEPGDLLFFGDQVWHGSFGGKTGRRMIAMNYKAKPNTHHEYKYIRDRAKMQREAQEHHESS